MQNFDDARKLGEKLFFYKPYPRKSAYNDSANRQNLWGAAYFFAAVLERTFPAEGRIVTREKINDLRDSFQQETGQQVDLEDLFKKGWLRSVFGQVSTPKAIWFGPDKLDELKLFKNEIVFLDGMSNADRVKHKTFDQLHELAIEYGKLNGTVPDLAKVKNKYFKVNENGTLEYYNTRQAIYTLENLSAFEFISAFHEFTKNDDLLIAAADLSIIYGQHCVMFTGTPPLEQLIANKVFQEYEADSTYSVHFDYNEEDINVNVIREAAVIFWERLLENNAFVDDFDRLNYWYYRMVFRSDNSSLCAKMPDNAKRRFLAAALLAVTTESDLDNHKAEYDKLRLDSHHAYREQIIPEYYDHQELSAIPEDFYEVYELLTGLANDHGDELLIEQGCRHAITYLLTELIANDQAFKFEHTFQLLRSAGDKIYAFWYSCFLLYYWHPEILPFLIINEKTAALGFRLLFKMNVANAVGTDIGHIKSKIIEEGFELLLKVLSGDNKISNDRKAKILFQCFALSTRKKFIAISNKRGYQNHEQADQPTLSETLRKRFTSEELPGIVYSRSLKFKKLFYPEVLDKLFKQIVAMQPESYGNGLIGLFHEQLDLMAWLIELSRKRDSEGEKVVDEEEVLSYLQGFINSYLEAINCKEVQKIYFEEGRKLKPALPSWMGNGDKDEFIYWGKLFLLMEQNFLFDEFLSPEELKFSKAASEYDDGNMLAGKKLRNHIFILIKGFVEIYSHQGTNVIVGLPVASVLSKLENKLTTLTTSYCIADPTRSRYNIFNEILERWTFGARSEELLPLIGGTINKFSKENRRGIIRELTKSDHLIRSLKMIEFIISEDEKKELLNIVLNEQNIQQVMDELSYADKQFVIQSLTYSPEFIKQAEAALKKSEDPNERRRISHQKFENEVFHFRANLLIAYHYKDLQRIRDLEWLDKEMSYGREFSSTQEKEFYEGLIYLDSKEPPKAYHIFNKLLSHAHTDKPVFALNRFASHLAWAGITENKQQQLQIYASALDEWNSYQQQVSNGDNLAYISEKISINKLEAFEALTMDEDFDNLYHELDNGIHLKQNFLEIRIKNLMRRKMQAQAEMLLQEAKNTHALSSGGFPAFITELEQLTITPETISYLTEQHNRIITLPPEKLVQVITGNGLVVQTVAEFILNELLEACSEMLFKVNALSNVHYEDKYSDLLMLILNSRLQHFHWSIETLRGGYSDKKEDEPGSTIDGTKPEANVGEIDFGFYSAKHELLAICEALILEGKNTTEVQKHNLKVFNYDPSRKLYFIVNYFLGEAESFDTTWASYIDIVQDFIEFQSGYELIGKAIQPEHNKTNASVKMAITEHASSTRLYHIFININYKLNLKKKLVRNKKGLDV
ncbi:hypothetical protein IDJ77_16210 [Mucilaginibacter sp. ZT4R22]|uniref:Cyclic nucleotide-binding domain-containing protein n=1 Tax=Mucilaginibacter pankratovii TaxID=2772110 RepID=A0ABR7WVC8_9SPHI|nr:hypothetical protein [Mucilaginibacter pankratovii]MBD1365359.1 hypothetical protein [Mucilaginibacter pankratovii]